jgi:hypothetical protein
MGGRRPATDDGGSLFVHTRITQKLFSDPEENFYLKKEKTN